jgi:hypothetical protein
MSAYKPYVSQRVDYAQRFLVRFQREVLDRGRTNYPFPQLCDMAAIPRDLRAALLQDLIQRGYVQSQGGELISLTAAGVQLVSTPPPPVESSDNPSPHDRESRVRTPGSGPRG